MDLHAHYEIIITDPKKGTSTHTPTLYNWRRVRRRMNRSERKKYSAKRSEFLSRISSKSDLDFHISEKKSTMLAYHIHAEGWKFDEANPVEFPTNKNGSNPPFKPRPTHCIWLVNSKELHLRVFGKDETDLNEPDHFEYCLNYIDPQDEKYKYDPIISNGTIDPPGGENFRLIPTIFGIGAAGIAGAAVLYLGLRAFGIL